MWICGWPLFLAARLLGGFPQWEAAGEKCIAGEVAGWVVHPWRCYTSALASVFQFVPNTGYGQPLSKEESEPIEREREEDNERRGSEKVGCQIESPHLFFSKRSTAKIMETFYFHSFWERREEGGLRRGFSAHSVIAGISGQLSTPLLCHEWCKCHPPRIDALWIYLQSCLWVKLTVCGPINTKICTEATHFVASSPCLVDFMPSLC